MNRLMPGVFQFWKHPVNLCLNMLLAPLFCLLLANPVFAQTATGTGPQTLSITSALETTSAARQVLPVDQAFELQVYAEFASDNHEQILVLSWQIKKGYYLYRKSLMLNDANANNSALVLNLPDATLINDEYFGETEVYHDELSLRIPFSALASKDQQLSLNLSYQGCAEELYCYPPRQRQISLAKP